MIATTSLLALATAGLAAAQSRTDEASAAQSTNPVQECTPYNYAPVAALVPFYPQVWHQPASIPASDSTAQALFNSFASKIPQIPTRGNVSSVSAALASYDLRSDDACWWTATRCTTPKASGLPTDVNRCPEPNTWGYTFDDGPNCSHNAFYNYMQSQNQKATLFYIGSNLIDWPLEGQRGLADGHELCAHTWSHPYMTALSNDQAFAELYYSKKLIKDIVGVTVQCWRPPFGDVDDRIRFIANQLGMATIMWAADTFDWNHAVIGESAVKQNYANIINAGKNGTWTSDGPIVLTHEIDNTTMVFAQDYYPQIKAAYSHVVPVNVCWNNTTPYLENDITYPSFDEYISGTTTVKVTLPTPSDVPVSIVAAGAAGPYTAAGSSGSGSGGKNPGGSGSSGDGSGAVMGVRIAPLLAMAATAVGIVVGAGWIAL